MGVNHLEDDLQSLFVFDFLSQSGFQLAMRNRRVELANVHFHAIFSVFPVPHSGSLHTLASKVNAPVGDIGATPSVGRFLNNRLENLHNGVVCALVGVERWDLQFPFFSR